MKFFVAFALIATVASAAIVKPTQVSAELAEIQEIIAAIQSPSTNPATAAALEQMLQDYLGIGSAPISVGPAIIESNPISVGPAIIEANPIAIGPAMIDFPLPDGGAVSAPVEVSPIVAPSPAPAAESASPALVQIIVNVNAAAAGVVPEPVQIVDNSVVGELPEAVQIVDQVAEPVQIVDTPVVVEPVQIVDTPVVVEPVQIVDTPVVVEPVQIGAPIIAAPAVNLPDELN